MYIHYAVKHFLYAITFSIFFTIFISKISDSLKHSFSNNSKMSYDTLDLTKIQNRCFEFFPIDHFLFENENFQRGMFVKINTHSNKFFEGVFMGINKDDIICLLTKKHIVAYKVDKIRLLKMKS